MTPAIAGAGAIRRRWVAPLVWRTALVGAFLVPVVVLLIGALSTRWFFPQALPKEWSFDGVRRIGGAMETRRAMWKGLAVSASATALAVLAAWPAARLIGRSTFRGRGFVLAVLFLPSIVPGVGLAMGIDVAMLRWHIEGRFWSVVLAHLVPSVPYAVAVLTATFTRHDERIEHQARVLGANPWQVFRLVTLPMIGPGVIVAAALTFLVSWSQYLLTLLVGGGRVITLTMLVFAAVAGGNPTTIGVLAILCAFPTFVLLSLISRHSVSVLTSGVAST